MDFQLTDEQQEFRHIVHEFVAREVKPMARHTDETGEFNWTAVKKMGPIGLLGLEVPEMYGGAEVDAISAAIAIEELGWGCGSTALAIAAHNGLALAPIVGFGSETQKEQWLPHLATGKGKLGCLALTEPGAGSDLKGGVRTTAVKEGDSWIIDGSKMWMTNASISDLSYQPGRWQPGAQSYPGAHEYAGGYHRSGGKENGSKGIADTCREV
jgi:alkylation response protein AidB-like acyl-CoA dehydrogenase